MTVLFIYVLSEWLYFHHSSWYEIWTKNNRVITIRTFLLRVEERNCKSAKMSYFRISLHQCILNWIFQESKQRRVNFIFNSPGLYEIAFNLEENQCAMTYMYEYPEYINISMEDNIEQVHTATPPLLCMSIDSLLDLSLPVAVISPIFIIL